MDRCTHPRIVRLRAALLWLLASASLAGVATLAVGPARDLGVAPGPDFARLLEQGCAAGALLAAAWLWLTTTHVAVAVVRSPRGPRVRRVGPARAFLLAACGVAVVGSTTPATAAADAPDAPPLPARALAGLPLPDRATAEEQTAAVVRVRPGDSLWRIAARHLGPQASLADVASYWRGIHRLNADVVGPDPDLVVPGQRLLLPPLPPPR